MIRVALTALALSISAGSAFADKAESPGPEAWMPKNGDRISFEVLRKGKPFGQHDVSFEVSADGTITATTDVDLKAGLGPLTVFKYALDATETWKDGKLVGITGAVDDDGDAGAVEAKAEGDQLVVNGTGFDGTLPLGTLPASHWNRAQMQASTLFSTEDGKVIDVKITEKGRESRDRRREIRRCDALFHGWRNRR